MGRSSGRRPYGKTRAVVASIARERIEILLGEARDMVGKNEKLSRRYVDLARRISERTKVRIPGEWKRFLCKGCGIALVPGRNARVRLYPKSSGIVITCLSCGTMKRYPITRRKVPGDVDAAMKPYIAQPAAFSKKNSSKD